jgi:hypothetical protein
MMFSVVAFRVLVECLPSGYAAWHIDQEKKRPVIVKNTSISIGLKGANLSNLFSFI